MLNPFNTNRQEGEFKIIFLIFLIIAKIIKCSDSIIIKNKSRRSIIYVSLYITIKNDKFFVFVGI